MKLTINPNEVGKEYLEELKKIIEIRKDRRLIYGDSFLQERIDNLLAIIDGKEKRFAVLRGKELKHEKVLDEARDICNYWIFILCLLNKKNQNENK